MSKKLCQFCEKEEAVKMVEFGNYCFDCWFWVKKTHLKPEDQVRQAIINGEHWMIGHGEETIFRGMGGRRYTILFDDDRLVKTRNLWHQGVIPDEFRAILTDNAVFIQNQDPEPACVEDEIPF